MSLEHDSQACVHLARRLAFTMGWLGPLHERANLLLDVNK
jgi:hypothetical protein